MYDRNLNVMMMTTWRMLRCGVSREKKIMQRGFVQKICRSSGKHLQNSAQTPRPHSLQHRVFGVRQIAKLGGTCDVAVI